MDASLSLLTSPPYSLGPPKVPLPFFPARAETPQGVTAIPLFSVLVGVASHVSAVFYPDTQINRMSLVIQGILLFVCLVVFCTLADIMPRFRSANPPAHFRWR